MDRLVALHARMSYRPSSNRGLTTVEMIMIVMIAATFIFGIAFFVNAELMTEMFKNVREVLGFKAKKG
jgi:hypothetical protein